MIDTIARWTVLAALIWCTAPAVAVADSENEPLVASLSRTTIFVEDIEQSLELYRDTLGLHPRVDRVFEGPALNQILGTKDQQIRIVILQSGESVIGNVALLAYLDTPRREPKKYDRTLDVGEVALVMETRDIDRIHEAVVEKGFLVISPPIVLFSDPKTRLQTREMMFVGPEGIAINLIQSGEELDSK